MTKDIIIHWFRQDLRLADNPSLVAAARAGTVLPIYILDDTNSGEHKMGAASRWWLHHSLNALNDSLDGNLAVYAGNPLDILKILINERSVKAVHWNRCYEPWRIARDKQIKESLSVEVESHNGSLLWEPWQALKGDGTAYRVFTPYFRNGCAKAEPPREPLPAPVLSLATAQHDGIDALNLLPKIPWDKQLEPHWTVGEEGAHARFNDFVENGLSGYKEGRNFPTKPHISRMSQSLHFGEVSPNQLWYGAKMRGQSNDIDNFCSELGWREFSHSLLYHFPDLPRKNLQPKFDAFPWADDVEYLEAWQSGMTGYPIVDAGMRELWQTGIMHNRVRMIVGSFLVKNLRLHWHHGEKWFWDTLVDADLAANSASWQWIAGCGADAAPYFRVFNPVTQSARFDGDGDYIRKYCPELAKLPNKHLFAPWEAPDNILEYAGVTLGKTYPKPIVNLASSRNDALAAFKSLKSAGFANEEDKIG